MKQTFSVLVQDESGVLSRISGLFARRGFNIASLAVGPAEKPGISRITMVINGDKREMEQLSRHLYKLVNVLKVQNITYNPCVERELMLIKISAQQFNRTYVLEIANIFRAKVVDLSHKCLILEVTGDPGKIVAIHKLLSSYDVIEVARTGKIALIRESNIDTLTLIKSSNNDHYNT